MKSMQRKFGKFGKRSENEADVQTVLDEFKAVDHMLDFMIKELTIWRNGWEDILKVQYETTDAFATLYKPIEDNTDSEMSRQSAQTPAKYLNKIFGLQKEFSDMKTDLGEEIRSMDTKVIRPVEEAKKSTKMLHKTIKHRENMKLDYERYASRAEHVRGKGTRTEKEETALRMHEMKRDQAQIDYQTADEQVRETFPPVSEAVMSLLPFILASVISLQTTMVGQLYTVMDAYTRKVGLPNPAPADAEIIATWDREFTSFRRETESKLMTLANGKVVNMSMNIGPEKDKTTATGFGIRNKVLGRNKNEPIPVRPAASSSQSASQDAGSEYSFGTQQEEEEEIAPPKPPRPGAAPSPGSYPTTPSPGPYGGFNKPRTPSAASGLGSHPANGFLKVASPGGGAVGAGGAPPPPYSANLANAAVQLPYPGLKPTNGTSPFPTSPYSTASNAAAGGASDYFSNATRRASQASSIASSPHASAVVAAAAAKKKPPPPIPAKRFPSTPAPQYVTAVYDFDAQNPGDLAFREGDRIKVVKKTGSTDDWWEGELKGVTGAFPANYVSLG